MTRTDNPAAFRKYWKERVCSNIPWISQTPSTRIAKEFKKLETFEGRKKFKSQAFDEKLGNLWAVTVGALRLLGVKRVIWIWDMLKEALD